MKIRRVKSPPVRIILSVRVVKFKHIVFVSVKMVTRFQMWSFCMFLIRGPDMVELEAGFKLELKISNQLRIWKRHHWKPKKLLKRNRNRRLL